MTPRCSAGSFCSISHLSQTVCWGAASPSSHVREASRHYLAPERWSSTSGCISKRPGLACSTALRGRALCVEPTLGNELRHLQLHLHGLDTLIQVNQSQEVGSVCVGQHLQPAPPGVGLRIKEERSLPSAWGPEQLPHSFDQQEESKSALRVSQQATQSHASYSTCPEVGLPSRTTQLSCNMRNATFVAFPEQGIRLPHKTTCK